MKLALFLIPVCCLADDATDIMRRVAENQERSQTARKAWVYDQNVFVKMIRSNGKPAREEERKYVVVPGEKGADRTVVSVDGKVYEGKKVVPYTTAGFLIKYVDIDGALTDSLARELMWRPDTIGPVSFWFPLSLKEQHRYAFQLEGEEKYKDYDVYKLSYKETDGDDDWEGEALIEKNELQPVLLTSRWLTKIPAGVRYGLGTNVTQVGAKVTYQRFDKDLWFPVSMGGEIKLRALFLYGRTIGFSSTNSGFHKADVKSSVRYTTPDEIPAGTGTGDNTSGSDHDGPRPPERH
jgi:hypothetical protein